MAKGGGAPGGEADNTYDVLWIIIITFILCLLIWFSFRKYLTIGFIKLRLVETYAIKYTIQWFLENKYVAELDNCLSFLNSIKPQNLNVYQAMEISKLVGGYLRWPIAVIMAGYAYLSYGKNIKTLYSKHYDMRSLARQESNEWPQIIPVLNQNIRDLPLDGNPWAMMEQPLSFAKRHKLVNIIVVPPGEESLSNDFKFSLQLDKLRAQEIFSEQLGKLWSGVDSLPLYKQAVFCIFAARICRDTQVSRDLITQINRSAIDIKSPLNFAGVDVLCRKYAQAKDVLEIIKIHAYEYTVMIDMLTQARTDGVVATSDLLWLKPRDRTLWYVLNCTGRRTPSVEAAAPHGHFLAEKAMGRSLGIPMVKEAVNALEISLLDTLYVPDPQEREALIQEYYRGNQSG